MSLKHANDETASTVAPAGVALAGPVVHVDMGALSHRGRVRPDNEDHFLVARLDRTMQVLMSNLPPDCVPEKHAETAYGMAVADGMGGHAAGEIASRSAISALVDLVLRTPDLIMRLDQRLTKEALRRFDDRFQQIKDVLMDHVEEDPKLFGMGTTLTVACSLGFELLVAHVGDSRAYMYREDRLQRLTRDHTMAQFLADTGAIRPEEIARHPMRHVLTAAIGTQGGKADVELERLRLADGDQILLCSDGLTDMVPDAAIADTLRRSDSASGACESLVNQALEAGGKDNVTVVLGRYRIVPAAA
jgi:serine/threonine protein phosphatase PrpC